MDSRAFSLHQLLRNFSTNMISQRTLGHISCKLLFHVLAVPFKTIQDHFLLAGGKPDNTFLWFGGVGWGGWWGVAGRGGLLTLMFTCTLYWRYVAETLLALAYNRVGGVGSGGVGWAINIHAHSSHAHYLDANKIFSCTNYLDASWRYVNRIVFFGTC